MHPPTVTTNILALPLLSIQVETGNSEDWCESLLYLVDTNDPKPQVDLQGIDFEMEIRRAPPVHEVLITASTSNGSLAIGEAPDFGYLIIRVPHDDMKRLAAGEYVADIRGTDDRYTRIVCEVALTVFDGVTR